MRLLFLLISIPVAVGFTWWGVGSLAGGPQQRATTTYRVGSRSFKVTIQEKGELKAGSSIDIKSEVEGRSTIISLVPEGSSVKKGDLLVEVASDEIEERVQKEKIDVASARAAYESAERQMEILLERNASDIRKAELNLELKELELKKYEQGEWNQQLEDAKLRIEEAKRVFERAKDDLDYAETLREKQFITESEYKQNEFDYYKAQVNLRKAERDLELLTTYTHVKDQRQKESDVEEARKELEQVRKEADNKQQEQMAKVTARKDELKLKDDRLKKFEDQMAKTKITAPADGLVVYGDSSSRRWWNNDERIKEGATVYERQTILQLPDTSTMKVVVRIHEAETDKIKVGQQATVEVEGVGDRRYTAEVSKIAVLADSQNRWLNPELKEYETELTLHESDELLKPGVTARVEILVAELDDVVAVPVQSVFTKGKRSFVFVGDGEDADPIEVQLGLASNEFVEVQTGLSEGQSVLLAVPEIIKHKLPQVEGAVPVADGEQQAPRRGRGHARRGGRRAPRSG